MPPVCASTTCPSDDLLGALVEHALEPDEAAQVAAHVDRCVACQELAVAAVREVASSPPLRSYSAI